MWEKLLQNFVLNLTDSIIKQDFLMLLCQERVVRHTQHKLLWRSSEQYAAGTGIFLGTANMEEAVFLKRFTVTLPCHECFH